MPLQTSGAISMGNIRIEYHLIGDSIDIGRLADIAGVSDNIGAFYGKNYINRFGNAIPGHIATSAGTMTNAIRSFDVTVRICIGINGSNQGSGKSVGWIWSKSNGSNGGNIYIYNNVLYVNVGSDTSVLSYAIPSSWTNNVIREIVWGFDQNNTQYLRVDGVTQSSRNGSSRVGFVGTEGLHHFLSLPSSDDIGTSVPAAARVAPSNIVAKRCDVWKAYYS
jgi:hypothetical protein